MLSFYANEIYIFKLLAAAKTIFHPIGAIWGRKLILFVGNVATCASPATGAAKSRMAIMLVYTM